VLAALPVVDGSCVNSLVAPAVLEVGQARAGRELRAPPRIADPLQRLAIGRDDDVTAGARCYSPPRGSLEPRRSTIKSPPSFGQSGLTGRCDQLGAS
jgi:hypothetical protein